MIVNQLTTIIKEHIMPYISDPPTILSMLIVFHRTFDITYITALKQRLIQVRYISSKNYDKCRYQCYPNGVKHGWFETYKLIDGVLLHMEFRCQYINGKQTGEFSTYYSRGQLRSLGYYLNGCLHGRYYEYYLDGTIKVEMGYLNGLREGYKYNYHNKGQLQVETYYHDDLKHGPYTEYYGDGAIMTQYKYHRNRIYGAEYEYYRDSRYRRVYIPGRYDNNKYIPHIKLYNPN